MKLQKNGLVVDLFEGFIVSYRDFKNIIRPFSFNLILKHIEKLNRTFSQLIFCF
jgi:hypothetical protein